MTGWSDAAALRRA